MALAAGSRLGAYEVIAKLGEGGMGEVYRARDTRLGREVALKVLPAAVSQDPSRLERFDREARAIAALNHPHIVTIYSTEEADEVRFLTMELIEGETLTEIMAAGPVTLSRFFDIGLALADALSAAHQRQITHRDLKPGNVMVSREGRVKVLDFGLARIGGLEQDGERSLAATRAPITELGTLVGTMPYMSPEQIEGRRLDPRTDLFSLGVILHEMLSGERLFKGDSSPALMAAILRDAPSSVSAGRGDVPEGLALLVARCLEKRPEDRVQTARDVYNVLRQLQKQLESGIRPASPTPVAESQINVFPFTWQGSDAQAIAGGLSQSVAVGLSRYAYLRVVARSSGSAGITTGYLVQGSVQSAGTRLRVVAQLTEAATGTSIWAHTFDRDLAVSSIFEVQDALAGTIVATIADVNGALVRSMANLVRRKAVETLTPYEAVLRQLAYVGVMSPAEHAQVRDVLEFVTKKAPADGACWAALASAYVEEYAQEFNLRPEPLARARVAAHKALECDPGIQLAHVVLAQIAYFSRDMSAFRAARDKALALNPFDSGLLGLLGSMTAYAGEWDAGLEMCQRAIALNLHHPGVYWISQVFNRYRLRDYTGALDLLNRVTMPNYPNALVMRAAICGQLGRLDEGRAAAHEAEACLPGITARTSGVRRKWLSEELVEHIQEGLDRLAQHGSV